MKLTHGMSTRRLAMPGVALASVFSSVSLLVTATATGVSRSPIVEATGASANAVIHLTISGGFRYTGTLANAGVSNGCFAAKFPATKGEFAQPASTAYMVSYNASEMMAALGSGRHPATDGFALEIQHYKPTLSQYSDPANAGIQVDVRDHAYATDSVNSTFTIKVQVARDSRSGRFTATHLAPFPHYSGAPINVQGTWSCAPLVTVTYTPPN